MFCCYAFENLLKNAGKRGLAVLVCRSEKTISFAIQMRSVDFAQDLQPQSILIGNEIEYLTLSASMKIRYCPSCGAKLADMVLRNHKTFEQYAKDHLPLQDDWGI